MKLRHYAPVAVLRNHGRPQKKMQGGQKHFRDGHLSESYGQVL